MIPSNVRAVFFDAVGTLIHPDPPAAVAYAEIGRRYGTRLSPADIAVSFRSAFVHEEEFDRANGLRTSEERERQRWRNIVARVLDDVTDPEACYADLFHHFSRPEAWRCDPEAAAVIETLGQRSYLLGLASNYDERLRSVLAGIPELNALRYVVISAEVGWRKPAPEFFSALSRISGVPSAEILFVGDDPVNDYKGARAAGMSALLLGRHLQRLWELTG
jgi:putative hydrolase of the HAD superfamily